MDWKELFDRAEDYEATVSAISETLDTHRSDG
jgi:hypothetical protein